MSSLQVITLLLLVWLAGLVSAQDGPKERLKDNIYILVEDNTLRCYDGYLDKAFSAGNSEELIKKLAGHEGLKLNFVLINLSPQKEQLFNLRAAIMTEAILPSSQVQIGGFLVNNDPDLAADVLHVFEIKINGI